MRRCRPPITATPTIALDSRRRPGCLLTESRGRPTRNGCPRRRPPPATLIEQGSLREGEDRFGGRRLLKCVQKKNAPTATRRCKRQRAACLKSDSCETSANALVIRGRAANWVHQRALYQPFQALHLCHLLFFFQDRRSTASPLVASLPSDVRDDFVSSSGGVRCVLPATFTGGRQSRTSTFLFFPFNFGTVLYSHSPTPSCLSLPFVL